MVEAGLLYDRYRVVRKLGSGAFATVYLADDTVMGRPVAVKIVSRSTDEEGRVTREGPGRGQAQPSRRPTTSTNSPIRPFWSPSTSRGAPCERVFPGRDAHRR